MKILVPVVLSISLFFVFATPSPAADTPPPPKLPTGHAIIPGTVVAMAWPEGFKLSRTFHGLVHRETRSYIKTTPVKGAYSKVVAGMAPDRVRKKNVKVLSSEKLPIGDLPGMLYRMDITKKTKTLGSWVLIFGDKTHTMLLQASFPLKHEKEMSEVLKKALTGTVWLRTEKIDPLLNIGFDLPRPESMTFARRLANTVVFTQTGSLPPRRPGYAMFIALASRGMIPEAQRKDFALEIMKKQTDAAAKVKSTHEIKIGGLSGYEVKATALEKKSKISLALYQVVLFDDETYYLLYGQVGAMNQQTYGPTFKKCALGFKPTDTE